MLESNLLVKLARAQIYWEQRFGNDAQMELNEAVGMAVDTEWEGKITGITEEQFTYDQLKEIYCHNNGITVEQLDDSSMRIDTRGAYTTQEYSWHTGWQNRCAENDALYQKQVADGVKSVIDQLDFSIGDKIHRRNMQVADLKRKIEFHPTAFYLPGYESLADFESRRKSFITVDEHGNSTWACGCGNREFRLMSSPTNIKAVCTKCGSSDIIAWYPNANDSSAGCTRNLSTGEWICPVISMDKLRALTRRKNQEIDTLQSGYNGAVKKILSATDVIQTTLADFVTGNVDRKTASLRKRFVDIQKTLDGTYATPFTTDGASGEWTRCSCGHIVQEHNADGVCGVIGCGCIRYDGHILPEK